MLDGLPALPRRALLQLAAFRLWPGWRDPERASHDELLRRLGVALSAPEVARVLGVRLRPGAPFHREFLTAVLGPPALEYALGSVDDVTLGQAARALGVARPLEGSPGLRRRQLAAALRSRPRGLVLPALGFQPDAALSSAELELLAAARTAHQAARDAEATRVAAEMVALIRERAGSRLTHAGAPEADKGKTAQAFERRLAAWTGREAGRGAGPDFDVVEFKAVPLLRGPRIGVRPADAKIKLCGVRVEPRDKLRHVVWGFFWKDEDVIAGAVHTFWREADIEALLGGDGIVEAPAGASGAGQRALYLRSRVLRERGLLPG